MTLCLSRLSFTPYLIHFQATLCAWYLLDLFTCMNTYLMILITDKFIKIRFFRSRWFRQISRMMEKNEAKGDRSEGSEDLSSASPCFWQLVMIDVTRRVFPKSIATNCREGDGHEVAIGNLSIAGNFGSFRAQFPRRCSW